MTKKLIFHKSKYRCKHKIYLARTPNIMDAAGTNAASSMYKPNEIRTTN